MRFSSRVPADLAPNSWSERLAARRASGAELLDLTDANPAHTGLTPPIPAPDAWEARSLARYEPEARGSDAARHAVARYYADRGLTADPASIVLTASTSEAYAHIFRVLADAGDTILVPRPSYPLFDPLARAEGVGVRSYRLAWDGRWHVDFDDLEAAFDGRTRAVVVVQPNHPTGSCLDAAERAALDALAARRGVAIVSDEVFGDFGWAAPFRIGSAPESGASAAPDAEPPRSLPSFAGECGALTFVLSGLSKVCGLPQMKLGWLVTAGPADLCARALPRLEWIADLFLSVSAPTQLALPSWLANRHDFQRRAHQRIAANLERLARARARAPELTLLPSEGGWSAVVRLPGRRREEQWVLDLLERGVITHPGHFYDFESESFAVVSLIVDPAVFDRGLERLEEMVTRS